MLLLLDNLRVEAVRPAISSRGAFFRIATRKRARAYLFGVVEPFFSLFANIDSGYVQAHGNIAEGDRVCGQHLVGREA